MDLGLLLLHGVVGLLMAGHGAQKLFGWFGGLGVSDTAAMIKGLGWRPARAFAVLLGAAEFVGGAALALGFATPLAGAGWGLTAVALGALGWLAGTAARQFAARDSHHGHPTGPTSRIGPAALA